MAEITDKAIAWLVSNNTSVSSKTLCALLYRVPISGKSGTHPRDCSDFGRCMRFLAILPKEAKEHVLHLAKSASPEWKALAGKWDHLESLYGSSDMYGQMKKIISEAAEGG